MAAETPDTLLHFKNFTREELLDKFKELGEPRFRVQQLVKWVYQKRCERFDQMNNIPKVMQQKFAGIFSLQKMGRLSVLESKNHDAVKFGFALFESQHIAESVLLYDGKRRTACLSSQLGCGLGCVFCETAKMGFMRNLTTEEIVGQLIGIDDYLEEHGDKRVTNIVFMGMGEALSNFSNFKKALAIIMDEDAFNIGGRRITVSTAGVVPSIERLMEEDLAIGLAISLNAYTNELRSQFMPINDTYPIEELVTIAKRYFEKTGRRVTFEYVIIDGVTNTKAAADALVKMLGNFPCKVNLIPVNPSSGSAWASPSDRTLDQFADELHGRGLAATVRRSRGQDISGACGQLSGSIRCTAG